MSVAKVTYKGQITIPKEIRDALGISEGDHVIIVVDGDKAILRPVRRGSLSELRGKLPATHPFPGVDQVRDEVGVRLGEQGG